jgi:hypothetical protein
MMMIDALISLTRSLTPFHSLTLYDFSHSSLNLAVSFFTQRLEALRLLLPVNGHLVYAAALLMYSLPEGKNY